MVSRWVIGSSREVGSSAKISARFEHRHASKRDALQLATRNLLRQALEQRQVDAQTHRQRFEPRPGETVALYQVRERAAQRHARREGGGSTW